MPFDTRIVVGLLSHSDEYLLIIQIKLLRLNFTEVYCLAIGSTSLQASAYINEDLVIPRHGILERRSFCNKPQTSNECYNLSVH